MMNNIFIALSIGLVAGIVDVIPMLIQKLDKFSCLSAFLHWIVLGLIIPYVDWNMAPWLKGLLIAELSAVPMMILVFPQDPKAIIPMLVFSAILGIAVGIAGHHFIH